MLPCVSRCCKSSRPYDDLFSKKWYEYTAVRHATISSQALFGPSPVCDPLEQATSVIGSPPSSREITSPAADTTQKESPTSAHTGTCAFSSET
ncbi:hypothetical protein IG631_15501 [Alternaria alternata]|nr:hypothetical protein IG631_15501 [Alternaria alternata]